MKRILFFLLLLVNLQLTTDKGSLSIGFGEVSAQRMVEYSITKKSTNNMIDGYLYCPYGCGAKYFYYTDLQEHIENNCPYHQKTHCYLCDTDYYPDEGEHWCPICCICNQPLKYCRCKGAVIIGKDGNKYTLGSSGWVPVDDVDVNIDFDDGSIGGGGKGGKGNQSDQNSNKLKDTDSYPRSYPIKVLKTMSGIKMLKNLPNRLHVQPENTHECVPRAIAFMLELQNQRGFNYDEVFTDLKNIAYAEGYDLENTGIPGVPPSRIENLYSSYHVTSWPLNESSVISFINKGIPVAIGALKENPHSAENHMVTVIGYDAEYFYVAAGNDEGSANMIPREDLRDANKRSKWFGSNLYYIEQ